MTMNVGLTLSNQMHSIPYFQIVRVEHPIFVATAFIVIPALSRSMACLHKFRGILGISKKTRKKKKRRRLKKKVIIFNVYFLFT